MKERPILNISSGSDNIIARVLSNLNGDYLFWINNIRYSSVEKPLQMIKFPEGSKKRREIFELSGKDAGRRAKKLGSKAMGDYVYWDGEVIEYNSPKHRDLLKMFIREKFSQNKDAMNVLLKTTAYELDHDVGPESPNTSLPKDVFLGILMEIRDKEVALRREQRARRLDNLLKALRTGETKVIEPMTMQGIREEVESAIEICNEDLNCPYIIEKLNILIGKSGTSITVLPISLTDKTSDRLVQVESLDPENYKPFEKRAGEILSEELKMTIEVLVAMP